LVAFVIVTTSERPRSTSAVPSSEPLSITMTSVASGAVAAGKAARQASSKAREFQVRITIDTTGGPSPGLLTIQDAASVTSPLSQERAGPATARGPPAAPRHRR
jgi:hypothetical protein